MDHDHKPGPVDLASQLLDVLHSCAVEAVFIGWDAAIHRWFHFMSSDCVQLEWEPEPALRPLLWIFRAAMLPAVLVGAVVMAPAYLILAVLWLGWGGEWSEAIEAKRTDQDKKASEMARKAVNGEAKWMLDRKARLEEMAAESRGRVQRYQLGQVVRKGEEWGLVDAIHCDLKSVEDVGAIDAGWYEQLSEKPKTPKDGIWYLVLLPREGSVLWGQDDIHPVDVEQHPAQ